MLKPHTTGDVFDLLNHGIDSRNHKMATFRDAEEWMEAGFTIGNPNPDKDIRNWRTAGVRFVSSAKAALEAKVPPQRLIKRIPHYENRTVGELLEHNGSSKQGEADLTHEAKVKLVKILDHGASAVKPQLTK